MIQSSAVSNESDLNSQYTFSYSLPHSHFSSGIVSRDAEKRRLCMSRGISLLTVPFWWNGQLSSLASSIVELRPDLIHYIDKKFISTAIPKQIPERYKSILRGFPLLIIISALCFSESRRIHDSKCEELCHDGKIQWHQSVS